MVRDFSVSFFPEPTYLIKPLYYQKCWRQFLVNIINWSILTILVIIWTLVTQFKNLLKTFEIQTISQQGMDLDLSPWSFSWLTSRMGRVEIFRPYVWKCQWLVPLCCFVKGNSQNSYLGMGNSLLTLVDSDTIAGGIVPNAVIYNDTFDEWDAKWQKNVPKAGRHWEICIDPLELCYSFVKDTWLVVEGSVIVDALSAFSMKWATLRIRVGVRW